MPDRKSKSGLPIEVTLWRRAGTSCAVLFGAGAIGLGAVLIFTDVLPLSGAGTGAGAAVAGVTVLVTVAYSMRELRRAEKADKSERAQPGGEVPGGPAESQSAAGNGGGDI
jgi:hypothetical protein